ncbi:tyrosine-type recombinase/integrase [Nocardioides agariphilus]|uniref:Tyrosine-type recombinase/integrase n=1 Tax=Nocardioides agariphilus TaxID=433664 RepID=A0A930YJT8_9ACTN|nr:tyrosine-type recombinase/integrase [Nocardioides agariphilus]MBF4769513.1 tyrosine-type recombinase/integrase [Nocardioides agariphilus]
MRAQASASAVVSSGLVFTTVRGKVLRGTNSSERVWRPVVARAGVGHCRVHDLRHRFASWLLHGGVSLAEVWRPLGHVSPLTTQWYAHVAETPRDWSLRCCLPQICPGGRRGGLRSGRLRRSSL